jgi:hypothetical protein
MTEKNDEVLRSGGLKEIPPGYLRKGDRFVAIKGVGVTRQIVAGVADMDGTWVSPDHGFRPHGNLHYATPETGYINVHLDGLSYDGSTKGNWPNTGLATREGWKILVDPAIYALYLVDLAENQRIQAERDATTEEAKAEARRIGKVARMKGDIAAMEEKIQSMKTTLEGLE